MKIHIEFEFEGVPGLAQDERGAYWRLPFTSENNKKFKAKPLMPVYERNYKGIRFRNKIYSDKILDETRTRVEYTIDVWRISPG